jgi:hypothetical protein
MLQGDNFIRDYLISNKTQINLSLSLSLSSKNFVTFQMNLKNICPKLTMCW